MPRCIHVMYILDDANMCTYDVYPWTGQLIILYNERQIANNLIYTYIDDL